MNLNRQVILKNSSKLMTSEMRRAKMRINKHAQEIDKALAKNKLREFLKFSPLKYRPYAQSEKSLPLKSAVKN